MDENGAILLQIELNFDRLCQAIDSAEQCLSVGSSKSNNLPTPRFLFATSQIRFFAKAANAIAAAVLGFVHRVIGLFENFIAAMVIVEK